MGSYNIQCFARQSKKKKMWFYMRNNQKTKKLTRFTPSLPYLCNLTEMRPGWRSSGGRMFKGRRLIPVFWLHHLKEAPCCAGILSFHDDWAKNKKLRAKSCQPDSKITSPLNNFINNLELFFIWFGWIGLLIAKARLIFVMGSCCSCSLCC